MKNEMKKETKTITINLSVDELLNITEMLEEYLTCYEHESTDKELLKDYEKVNEKLVDIYNDYFENNR